MCFAVVVVSSFAFRFASTSLACAESLRRDRRGAAPAAHLAVGLRSTSTCRRPRADDPPRNALPSSRSSPPANQQLPDRRPRGGPSALLRGEARSVSAPRFVREFVPGGFSARLVAQIGRPWATVPAARVAFQVLEDHCARGSACVFGALGAPKAHGRSRPRWSVAAAREARVACAMVFGRRARQGRCVREGRGGRGAERELRPGWSSADARKSRAGCARSSANVGGRTSHV